jgi:Icc-related predicted phosphoesterase
MKILCISDQIDPLVYSTSIRERFKGIDIVLSAGDLPADYLEFIVSSLNKPLLFVFGNHNLEGYQSHKEELVNLMDMDRNASLGSGAVHIGSKVKVEEGFIIAGLGGSMMYNRGENQYTNREMYLEILKLIPGMLLNRIFRGRFLDILLTHAAPQGIHDKSDRCHQGFKAFLWFMRTFKPKYLIHGHIHLSDLSDLRTTKYQDTLVINAYGHYIIDTEEETQHG